MNGEKHANEFLSQIPGWVVDERNYFYTYFLPLIAGLRSKKRREEIMYVS